MEHLCRGTVTARNLLFFRTFSGVLWPSNGANANWKCNWCDNSDNDYWKNPYTLTIKSQGEEQLQKSWEESLTALKGVAKGTTFDPLVSSLDCPFDLFKSSGFLLTVIRIVNSSNYKKEGDTQPFHIGPQYYVIANADGVKEYKNFWSKIESVEKEFKTIEGFKASVAAEHQQKHALIRQHFDAYLHAFEMYVEGTVPTRNKAYSDAKEKEQREKAEKEEKEKKEKEAKEQIEKMERERQRQMELQRIRAYM